MLNVLDAKTLRGENLTNTMAPDMNVLCMHIHVKQARGYLR